MKAIIWDLDGTLIDSYKVIVESICDELKELNIEYNKSYIANYVQTKSVTSYLKEVSQINNYSIEHLFNLYYKYSDVRTKEINILPNAKDILEILYNKGIQHFIYTHKNKVTFEILKNLDMLKYFTKILTIDDGFRRKPDPEAINYLIKEYKLDKSNVFYVGDRDLDIESANNAKIKSIFYKPENSFGKPTGKETYVVYDLLDIQNFI
mgnify:CR=1 FL=1